MAQQGKARERFSPPAVGGISLLVVFAVLCLTVFALLALTTVQADKRLADASAQAVANYYAADCAAQEILARLRNGERPEGVEIIDRLGGHYAVRYAVPISDTQELQVEVEFMEDWAEWADADWRYQVVRWQAVPTGEWEGDESLDIWDGTVF